MREGAVREMMVATQPESMKQRRQAPGWLRTPWAPVLAVLALWPISYAVCLVGFGALVGPAWTHGIMYSPATGACATE